MVMITTKPSMILYPGQSHVGVTVSSADRSVVVSAGVVRGVRSLGFLQVAFKLRYPRVADKHDFVHRQLMSLCAGPSYISLRVGRAYGIGEPPEISMIGVIGMSKNRRTTWYHRWRG